MLIVGQISSQDVNEYIMIAKVYVVAKRSRELGLLSLGGKK